MKVIAIEEHWTTPGIDRALRSQHAGARDESIELNDRGDIPTRLLDIAEERVEAMDAAGVDVQIVSIAPPGTNGLPAREAIALSRDANDRATEAVSRHPSRLAAMATLPMSDPDAALTELLRTANLPGHVGVMSFGRSGERALDDPVYDDLLGAAAALGRPVFIHPQIPPNRGSRGVLTVASIRPSTSRSPPSAGGGISRRGSRRFDSSCAAHSTATQRLQIVLGHWGEMLLFALDRIDSLSNVAPHLERRVGRVLPDQHLYSEQRHVGPASAPARTRLHDCRPHLAVGGLPLPPP